MIEKVSNTNDGECLIFLSLQPKQQHLNFFTLKNTVSLVFETFSRMCHSDGNSEEHLDLVSKPIIPPSFPLFAEFCCVLFREEKEGKSTKKGASKKRGYFGIDKLMNSDFVAKAG